MRRTVVYACVAGYLVGVWEANAIQQGVIADDHGKHTGPIFLPTGPSSSASVSDAMHVSFRFKNPMGGDDITMAPREIKQPVIVPR